MRKLFPVITSIVAILSFLFGCRKKETVTEIPLPESNLVGKSLPRISGSLAEYIDIPTSCYVLDFHDSLPRLTLKIRVAKAKDNLSLVDSEILFDSTYVTLIDSLGIDLSGFILRPDTNQMKTLNTLLKTEGVFGELTFTGEKVTDEFKHILAMHVRNFHLNGALGFQLKEDEIDTLLNQWQVALKNMNSYITPPAMVPGIYINAYLSTFKESNRIRRLLENHTEFMNEKQRKCFNALNKQTPRHSLI
ncbi:MAG: hypothetical protein K2J63_11135 [Muribaculaceae bacterium]|nr:hypothetical protein [Muribaculaceae bacterium]MDE6795840.1 hypothetical protein [Muribaculaceae bacterium]